MQKAPNKHGWFSMPAPKFDGRKCKAADTEGVCIAPTSKHSWVVIEARPTRHLQAAATKKMAEEMLGQRD